MPVVRSHLHDAVFQVRACDKNGRRTITADSVHCHVEGERSQGRQPKTWMMCIKSNVAEQDKSVQQAVELVLESDRAAYVA